MKQDILDRAKDVFGKNPGVNTVYVTSDGNIFTAEHYAHNWKIGLTDKAVTPITRNEALGIEPASAETEAQGSNDDVNGGGSENAEKAEYDTRVKRYIELFDTKPGLELTLDDINAAIGEKETGLVNGGNKDEEAAKAERDAAIAKYTELFGKKPNHLTGTKTLLAKIAEKEAEAK